MMVTSLGRDQMHRSFQAVKSLAFAACIAAVAYPAGAQSSQLKVASSFAESSSSDGVGSAEYSGVADLGIAPVPASAAFSTSRTSPSNVPSNLMIAAVPANSADDNCLEKIPANPYQGASGSIPNAPSAYVPLSSRCKLLLFKRRAYSPYTLASAAFEAGIAQMSAEWPQYGGGMQGWGKRLGATLADTESRRFIQTYVLSTVLHQDPRYFPSTQTSLIGRAWYAATRVLITRGDSGRSEFNTSEMLGALSTSALQNAYYPQHYRTVDATIGRFTGALSSDATSAMLREFTPDLKRMFNRHCPKKLKSFEARLPLPEEDKP